MIVVPNHMVLGLSINQIAEMAVDLAKAEQKNVTFQFYGQEVTVRPTSDPHDIIRIAMLQARLQEK